MIVVMEANIEVEDGSLLRFHVHQSSIVTVSTPQGVNCQFVQKYQGTGFHNRYLKKYGKIVLFL